jgi:CRP-like cAMP-binding protein
LQALFSLFGWTEGRFEFREEPVKKKNVINKNRMEIILDGTRLVDDGKIKKLGPVTFEMTTATPSGKEFSLPVIKGPFVDYMYVVDEEEFFEGDEIVVEGSYGNWMWVILEGMVEVSKHSSKGPLKILRLKEGAYVGSLASFLVEGNVRSASAKAATRVQLGMLDTQRLIGEYSKLSSDMRYVVNSLDKRLKQVSNNIVDIFCNQSKIKSYLKDKKAVIEQGKSEERLFRITQGAALVFRNTEYGPVPMAMLEKGDVFGSIPFLKIGHEPHTASVYASKELKISPIDGEMLKE